ncbi:hypothetical protein [Pyrobaculum neutrophilum]|uniref:Uncharacterized protein n=1 Tax=Pyrobaculum neutrophilum (strain DSM 2338 / JCM 9278 / NBRC 100436 / V24Sta) TaxID=444157 RepID=B1YCM2_PYRNV|nr:hypothetical protein [Pyrobaculum neutrophilum]ACB39535.1 conserved hypothetical protein [Pyrobaculum neutrophilum V24Sta]
MLGFLYLLINATAAAVPITAMPFIYTAPLGGCANFTAYVDPLAPWGIASVYGVSSSGSLVPPALDPYPTPKYLRGRLCGDYITVRVDRWRSLGPLIPVSVKGEDSAYLLQGVPYVVNGTAIVRIKSFTPPQVEGRYVYRVYSASAFGVYAEEYVVYGGAQIYAYGIANVTYISLSDDKPDYYVEVPTEGVKVDGVRGWTPDFQLYFAPGQRAVVGKPRIVVEQIAVPVVGECRGTATVVNPTERPLRVYVKLETGEEYALSFYYLPKNITTWRLRGAQAKTADGQDLPVYMVATDDGTPVSMCVVSGASYAVYVKAGESVYRYPAEASGGVVEAYTDLVKPKAVLDAPGFTAVVQPEVAKMGQNVTVKLFYNGTQVAEFVRRAAPVIAVNASSLFRTIRVVDALGTPIPAFTVAVGGLKFAGRDGVARVIPLDSRAAVEVNGVAYLVQLQTEVKIPTLTPHSFLKIAAAAATVGAAAAFIARKRGEEGPRPRGDLVEV